MLNRLKIIEEKSLDFISKHSTHADGRPLSGNFSLFRGSDQPDLYGMIDAVYTIYTLGLLEQLTDKLSREKWASRIIACQDEEGWFSRQNLRGHSREHATAYAIGALSLLEVEPEEKYLKLIKPLQGIYPLLKDKNLFIKWITSLNFQLNPKSILRKNVGWHYIWRGSHVGGGIPAAIGMTQKQIPQWWLEKIEIENWFNQYFNWLDENANPKTGYWQRAFWNIPYKKPTVIDMGGAVHFLWIYKALARPFPYPEAVILSTLSLQKPDGLYRDHPYCIDLDGNFCLTRSYLQLSDESRSRYKTKVYQAAAKSFEGITSIFAKNQFEDIYIDTHGLPGALTALVECRTLPDFKYNTIIQSWRNPLDKVWWL